MAVASGDGSAQAFPASWFRSLPHDQTRVVITVIAGLLLFPLLVFCLALWWVQEWQAKQEAKAQREAQGGKDPRSTP